ncbi:MAG: TIGR02996 domain-containing protein [Proteobacteria bacterium]|nr:TIGR02996 domain-containing protein [Pseudomonadota bacterium]
MNKDLQNFIDAIKANPSDKLNYSVLADWLDEKGDARGELIRLNFAMVGDDGFGFPAVRNYSRGMYEMSKREDEIVLAIYDQCIEEAGIAPVTPDTIPGCGNWRFYNGLLSSVRITDSNRAGFFSNVDAIAQKTPVLKFTSDLRSHYTAEEHAKLATLPIETLVIKQDVLGRTNGLQSFEQFTHLKTVFLEGRAFSGADLPQILAAPNLTGVHLKNLWSLNDDHLQAFTNNKKIQHLSLPGGAGLGHITHHGLAHLAGLPLKSLNLSKQRIGGNEAAAITSFQDLEELVLHQCQMETLPLTMMTQNLPRLKALGIARNNFGPAASALNWVDAVLHLKGLEELNVADNSLGNRTFGEKLTQLTKLRFLDVTSTRISNNTDHIIPYFAHFPELAFLEASRAVFPIDNKMEAVAQFMDMIRDGTLSHFVHLPIHVKEADSDLYDPSKLIEMHKAREASAPLSGGEKVEPDAPKQKWQDRVSDFKPNRKLTRKISSEGPTGMAL